MMLMNMKRIMSPILFFGRLRKLKTAIIIGIALGVMVGLDGTLNVVQWE